MSSSKPVGWEQLGDYKLLGKFARGQSCVLHLALHREAVPGSSLRAVKMPIPENSEDAGFASLLVGEAQLLACIQHPNVLAAHGFGRERGGYVALDYVEGDDFQTLQAHGRSTPDPRIVAAIIADTLQGLDAVHNAVGEVGDPLRAVHQAPHARHILVGTDGRARLADFTHARVQRPTSERRRPSRLEAAYRAPEQVLTPDQVDARTDLFVLGIAFWEALTGQSLFGSGSVQQASQNLLSAPIAVPSQVSGMARFAALDQVCLRALERDPQARWASAKEMLAALLDAALAIGGIALPAEVGRWVSVQAAAQLQARRALAGGSAPDSAIATPSSSSIPPPNAALGRLQNPEMQRPFDRSKTLMGTGLSGFKAANAAPQGTVLAETEPKGSFRPSRPPSSRPPPDAAPNASKAAEGPQAAAGSDAPQAVIDTEGVDVGRPASSQRPGSRELPGDRRGRVTEEYVLSALPGAPNTGRPAPIERVESSVASVPAPISVAAPRTAAEPAASHTPEPARSALVATAPPPTSPTSHKQEPKGERKRTSSSGGAAPPVAGPPGSGPRLSAFLPRSVLVDLVGMSLFAVLTVLIGDGLIRLWFGSPYGEPHVDRIEGVHSAPKSL